MSFSPRSASADGKRVQLARINNSDSDASERLFWITGKGVTSTSVKVQVPVPKEAWVQLQLGVDADGRVELWAFDGARESLVGTGRSTDFAGATKDRVSIGNHNPNLGITFEGWIDDFAVGETRLRGCGWTTRGQAQLKRLAPAALPKKFSFVFGSCTNSNHVPATGTGLGSAADSNPDFVVHLGDFGYLDSAAYAQSLNGYLASWSDLLAGDAMARLAEKPWLFICSDHDLGGNNTVATTVAPFAAERSRSSTRTTKPQTAWGATARSRSTTAACCSSGRRACSTDPRSTTRVLLATRSSAPRRRRGCSTSSTRPRRSSWSSRARRPSPTSRRRAGRTTRKSGPSCCKLRPRFPARCASSAATSIAPVGHASPRTSSSGARPRCPSPRGPTPVAPECSTRRWPAIPAIAAVRPRCRR